MSDAPDQAARDRAVAARDQTVLIDAGAGAGKTTILVARIISMVAPLDDAAPAMSLLRIAAVTFTRRAAGELRLRVRELLLKELTRSGLTDIRKRRLLDALGAVDAAALGTIHGFADRLLRLQPMKARLSPAYRIADDTSAFIDETLDLLLHAVQNGTLASELAGQDANYAVEVERTFQEALRAGFLVRSVERDPAPTKVGLDLLVQGFIEHRDRELDWQGTGEFDVAAFVATANDFLALLKGVVDDAMPGTRWMLRLGTRIAEQIRDPDPLVLYELVGRIASGVKRFKKTKHFTKKSVAQSAWATFTETLADALVAPLEAAMARRMARTRHAIVHLYETIKTRHEALDQLDLLFSLRNLLRDDLAVRGFYQQLFDHILVDELQDTDPLQAEIVLYLSEQTPKARRWQDVVVGKGRLTLVGDPKQSIYRFRRADIGMYDQIRTQIAGGDHVAVTLSANFRSVPTLIHWVNDRFADILGTSPDQVFDPATGQVFHQAQTVGRIAAEYPAVHALPYRFANGEEGNAGPSRALEGHAIAAYLRWLIEHSGFEIPDADTGARRQLRWSDIAILGLVTSNLPLLFDAFDRQGVPYAMAGGVLFTSDPLHQQFLLGLRAIADRNDGVAEAALLRAPFFAIDLLDLVREKALANDAEAARATAAREWVHKTRQQRFARSPGRTARALLEETNIGRAVALGPNGEQRLRHLREICIQLELLAAADGLDYDGVTSRLRDWVDQPPKLDPPRPVGAEAIQVLTVHQAKGLEFPVVVLWDGLGRWKAHESTPPWRVDRNGTGWSMKTHDVTWEEPPGNTMLEQESAYANSEKRRLVYVAATRARDLLVVPKPDWEQSGDQYIHARLLATVNPAWVRTVAPYVEGSGASWSTTARDATPPREVNDSDLVARWTIARDSARLPRRAPRSVTALAKGDKIALRVDDTELEDRPQRPPRVGRFGPVFGDAVHRAIGLALVRGLTPTEAVELAAAVVGLPNHHAQAAEDVERALTALHADGLVGDPRIVRLEYPVAAPHEGQIVSGYIDLVSAGQDDIAVIDFKTDHWPRSITDVNEAFPAYVVQVRTYAGMVGAKRAGLLFTGTGRLTWI